MAILKDINKEIHKARYVGSNMELPCPPQLQKPLAPLYTQKLFESILSVFYEYFIT
jgi:hypothetical protein